MSNQLEIQDQQRQNITNKVKQFFGGETDTQVNLRNRISGILSKWTKAGTELKEAGKKAIPEFIVPGKPALTVAANIPTVAARTAIDLVPTTPLEVGATVAAGPVGRVAGKAISAVGKKVTPELMERINVILKKPTGAPIYDMAETNTIETLGIEAENIADNAIGKFKYSEIAPQQKAVVEKIVLTDPKLNIERTKDVVTDAIKKAMTAPEGSVLKDQSKRVFKRISEALGAGEIMPENLPAILKQNNISPQDFAQMFVDTASTAGKQLYQLSRYAKEIGKYLPEDAANTLKKAAEKTTAWDMLKDVYRAVDNPRRALAVTQFATAVRNAISQGATYSLKTVEDALTGVYRTTVKGEPVKDTMRQGYEDVMAVFRRFSPKARAGIDKILNDNILEKTRIQSNLMGDITLGNKVLAYINTPNRIQETFFRKLSLDARLNALLGAKGKTILTASRQEIAELLPEVVDHALKMTFAASPKNGLGAAVNRVYREIPMLTTINPFPRFWANSLKFLTDYSPSGFARLFDPKFVQQMASKNGTEAFQALAKAQVGTLMYAGAFALRNSKYAGDKWYEIKTGDGKYIDMRPYAPFSTYLFIAEAIKEIANGKSNLTPADYAQGILSISRIAGTGLALIDWLRASDATDNVNSFKSILGQYVGTFTVPLRTVSDFIAGAGFEEKYIRDLKTRPITGPAISNIPGLSRKLPYARSIFRELPIERENPAIRQITGFTVRTKNTIEKEVDRLGISVKNLLPRTGDPMFDLQTKKIMGKMSDNLAKLINSPAYKKLEDIDKKEAIKEAVAKIRQGSMKTVKMSEPKKATILRINKQPDNKKKRIIENLLKNGKYKASDFTEMGINLKKLGILE